jgi:hypothetical protein
VSINFSDHALLRLAQRGIPTSDVELLMTLGTEVEGGYLILDRDLLAAEKQLKRTLTDLRRLRGKRLVLQHGTLITAYHASRRKRKSLLRNAEEREVSA